MARTVRVILQQPVAVLNRPTNAGMYGLRQQGGVLVLGTIMLAAAALMLVRYHAVGQMAAHKIGQDHALDAAAYSGAIVQARSLNTLGYVNRAHVGHQIAMAHLVTLGAWALWGGNKAAQLASGNPPAHVITMFFGPEHGQAYLAAARAAGFQAKAGSGGDLARAYTDHDTVIRTVLVGVQHDIVRTLPSARERAIRQILHEQYPEVATTDFNLSISHDNWHGFLERTSGHNTLRSLVLDAAAMYRFLDPRNHTASNTWMVDGRCPALRHQLRRRGHTTLNEAGVWSAVDTESFHALRSNRWIGCYYREYAMGWGWIPASQAEPMGEPHVDDPPVNFSAQDFWRWVSESTQWNIHSGTDNPLANSFANAQKPHWQGGGLPAVYDVANQADQQGLKFALTLKLPGPESLTVTSHSAARTFFARPNLREDGRHERPNLFRPYWQAGLIPHPVMPGTPPGQGAP